MNKDRMARTRGGGGGRKKCWFGCERAFLGRAGNQMVHEPHAFCVVCALCFPFSSRWKHLQLTSGFVCSSLAQFRTTATQAGGGEQLIDY